MRWQRTGGGRFVDGTKDVDASDDIVVLGVLTMRVVEVGRTVITAFLTVVPRYTSAVSRIFIRTIDEISSGDCGETKTKIRFRLRMRANKSVRTKVFVSPQYSTWMDGLSEPDAATTLNG